MRRVVSLDASFLVKSLFEKTRRAEAAVARFTVPPHARDRALRAAFDATCVGVFHTGRCVVYNLFEDLIISKYIISFKSLICELYRIYDIFNND